MKQIKVTLKTITPLWTGDAWQENTKIRPSSLMGSLRFWFYIYSKAFNIPTEKLNDKGIPSDNLDEYIRKYNKINYQKHTFESLLKLESKDLEENEDINNAIKKVLNKINLPLISQIFGCTGWKSQVTIKNIDVQNFEIKKSDVDYSFLYKKMNTRAIHSSFWTNKLLFKHEDKIIFFKNVKFYFYVADIYFDDIKRFLKFYENKIILVGGKKSFGLGFCNISSDLDLEGIKLPDIENKIFIAEKISIPDLPANEVVLGFNFKHYQRLKEEKRFRVTNFGKQGQASKFFFSAYDPDNFSDIYVFGFKDELKEELFNHLLNKYKNFEENRKE
ncbi:MAG: type III-B CRISPR module RAMP protein Cmr1 [Desulfonauticus sp.]|nr:type III-B CRISPR module RAMP protein Cmr1 [Desulfonauticus sp.]